MAVFTNAYSDGEGGDDQKLLSKITPLLGNTLGLYRDDVIAALNKRQREIEDIKKTDLHHL